MKFVTFPVVVGGSVDSREWTVDSDQWSVDLLHHTLSPSATHVACRYES